MSKLNSDVLYHIFQDLHYLITANSNNERNFKKSLHHCLLINKHWCEIIIQILWSYPYKYAYNKKSLLDIIISHLSDNSIKFLKDKNIIEANYQKQKLSFNYVRFCKYLNNIHEVIPDEDLLKEEIYKLFISECSSIKCLSSNMISVSICKYPGSNISLSNLYELDIRRRLCTFYHELAQICRSIEKIYISIYEEISGIAELIEMQKQIKYIFIDKYHKCKKINQALEKHVNSIVHLNLHLKTNESFQYDFLLPKLVNLQYLRINDTNYQLSKHKIYLNYYNLQILDLLNVSLDIAIDIIQNTNGSLWKIKIKFASSDRAKEYNQSIYKYCPNIKYVTVFLTREGTLEELEKIFINCQHLVAIDIDEQIMNKYYDKFLDLLVELAPFTLYKIHLGFILFNEESLKLFFTKWRNRCKKTLHLYHRTNHWHKFIEICEVEAIELNYYDDDFWNHEIKWSNE
ncbi:uncharacterized protein OCT59_020942 [Rhizophagus irregularis]|uniref:F-box domain-containing protein n=3 Tax=Rhizophagus irregularis TaxID=588596 RepID=U9SSE8_RHIID|nr:hypothetical protein GLOIN_2v1772514 [Rhizophagus irregularis DAOM 181602=DAOM 197198]EXX63286.1 hypothetical protein RirG_153680 [Rhizophagus irregularis DAOM 197198w]UZO02462.1 hypothetical protein OCT59_020942 [Rhizophagus irregularis]POG73440.1 hypothetical protein GLOIN_2v1772514 [Rhizophagus irregularis DAOM 181602=DAOM 197198]CAG8720625.1 1628_t:CDS:1 [Rhizophagus irregularis]GBC26839.1 hypothetical protein GLOIN_2v1772514 [Rhizophagus irregularis DAOM 181602=DAOM 197198]|eukprot:XP_025180306.1 hypothetical protein GLOIN_2v1772514 [Rhizophagus irregularis DAOM 181602=DAOM 197198]